MSKPEKVIVSIIGGALTTVFSLLGWNNLGAADALGAPHLSIWPMVGLEWFVAGLAYTAGQAAARGVDNFHSIND